MKQTNRQALMTGKDLDRLLQRHNIATTARQEYCELVSPGGYQVKTGTSGFLSSSLGAGVGLALYDAETGVGGLIHFLMSKPIGRSSLHHPARYASSGLDDFIEKLLAAGASKEKLRATVAGGCMTGQPQGISREREPDPLLSERVLSLLDEQQIPLDQVVVGGHSPCSLLLDTTEWRVTVQLFGQKQNGSALRVPKLPTALEIDQAIATVKPIPQVALKVLQLLGEESDVKFTSLKQEIKKDQVIASRVLHYCNSPIYNLSQKVDSIDRALVMLGENNLFEIVVSAAVDFIYSDHDSGYALMKGGLYRHALATAHLARELTFFTGCVEPGQAYTAGLIHDIGKLVLDRFVADTLPFFYHHLETETTDLIVLEDRLFGTNHMEVGARLANQWQLPEYLAAVIEHHHVPNDNFHAGLMPVHITYIADYLASSYLAGTELERVNTEQLESSLAAVGLRAEQLPYIIDSIPWQSLMAM